MEIPWCSITRIDIRRGSRQRTRTGAAIGAVFPGLPLGLLALSYVAVGNIDCEHQCLGAPMYVGAALVGVGAGVGIGALIGSLVRTDIWEPVPGVQVRASLAPRRGGIAAGVSVSF